MQLLWISGHALVGSGEIAYPAGMERGTFCRKPTASYQGFKLRGFKLSQSCITQRFSLPRQRKLIQPTEGIGRQYKQVFP